MTIEEKAKNFYCALTDCYKDDDDRNMHNVPKIKMQEDMTEDVTAILLAMLIFVQQLGIEEDMDLVGFTHFLNRLAIQCVFSDKED